MPNIFVNLPVPTSNAAGAAVDVSEMGATKTILVGGGGAPFDATVTIEYATDAAGTKFAPVPNGSFVGNPGRVTLDLAAHWMRAVTSAYKGGTPNADVGSSGAGSMFVQLGPVAVDISALPRFKTVVVDGACNVEVSEDGITYSQAFSFQTAGGQSAIIYGQFARVTGGVGAWMGAAEEGDGDVIDSTPLTAIVFRPGDPAGSRHNVYVTWAEAYAAVQAVHGLGIVYLQFDDTFAPCSVPPGVYNMDDVIWTNTFRTNGGPTVAILEDGVSIVMTPTSPPKNFMVYGRGFEIQSDRVGPIAPFVGIDILLDGGAARLVNTDPAALPMIEVDPLGTNVVRIAMTGTGFRSSVGELQSSCPAPLIDVKGGNFFLLGGAGTIGNNALTGTGFALINPTDDSFSGGNDFGNIDEWSNPAFTGVLAISVTQVARDFFAGNVTLALSPYQASYSELVLVDSSTGAITINAPSANPSLGTTFTVKDIGDASVLGQNITILPTGADTLEAGAIATKGGSKTWMADGAGNWRLISAV